MGYFDEQIERINTRLDSILSDGPWEFRKASRYAAFPEGHRYRSLVGLEVYNALGGDDENFLDGVVGIELIHHSSLIFDDLPIMDNSSIRKGKPAVHIEYGPETAILAGLNLLEQGQHLIYKNSRSHTDDFKIIDKVADDVVSSAVELIEGQEIDLETEKTEEELRRSSTQKTSLFRLACVLPSHVLNRPEAYDSLYEIGNQLSLSYQMFDDLRDVEGDAQSVGKPVGVDSDNLAIRLGSDKIKEELNENIGIIGKLADNNFPDCKLKDLVKLILTKQC